MKHVLNPLRLLIVMSLAGFAGWFFGMGAYDYSSGQTAGGLSGAAVGVCFTAYMMRGKYTRWKLLLAGCIAGAVCGAVSGTIAHVPSLFMNVDKDRFLTVPIEVGAVWGLCTGVILGGLLSFIFPAAKKDKKEEGEGSR